MIPRLPHALALVGLLVAACAAEELPPLSRIVEELPPGVRARFGDHRLRHPGLVCALALAPDGRTVVSVGGDWTLRSWDLATGEEVWATPVNDGATFDLGRCSLAISPDGRTLATGLGYGDTDLQFWDAGTGKKGHTLARGAVDCVVFSPDGKSLLATVAGRPPTLWEVASGKELRALEIKKDGRFVFSPDGRTLACPVREPGEVRLFDVESGKQTRTFAGKFGPISSVEFSPDGRSLAACDLFSVVRLWDVEKGEEVATIRLKEPSSVSGPVAFCRDGKTILVGSGRIHVIDVASKQVIREIGGRELDCRDLAVTPDGETVLAGSGNAIRLWDTESGAEIGASEGHRLRINALAVSRDGRWIVTGGEDNEVRLWDVSTGKPVRLLTRHDMHGVRSVAISPDGALVASGGNQEPTRITSLRTGEAVRSLVPKGEQSHVQAAFSIEFSSDGRTLISTNYRLRTWDVASGKHLADANPLSETTVARLSPDGRLAACGGRAFQNAKVSLWDLEGSKEVLSLPASMFVNGIDFSRDGRLLATGGDDAILHVWEVATGKERHRFESEGARAQEWERYPYEILAVAFSAQGALIAVLTGQGKVRMYDLVRDKEVPWSGWQGRATCMSFMPDGQSLVLGMADTTVVLCDIPSAGRESPAAGQAPDPAELEAAWKDLGSPDARLAGQAIQRLVAAGTASVDFLAARLAPGVDHLGELAEALDANDPNERQRAKNELAAMGDEAGVILEATRGRTSSSLVQSAVEELLDRLPAPLAQDPVALQRVRAVEALEAIGDERAREVLEGMAGSSTSAAAASARLAAKRGGK